MAYIYIKLKKVNISIIKYPLFFQFLWEHCWTKKSSIYSVLCDFSFPVKCALFCKRSDTVHKQHIHVFLSPSNCLDSCRLENGTTFISRPWIKYIVEVEKILGIAGFKSIPVFYYSLIGNDFHDHKHFFSTCFFIVAPALARRCDIGVPWPVRSSTIDLWTQLLLQFLANPFETSQMF